MCVSLDILSSMTSIKSLYDQFCMAEMSMSESFVLIAYIRLLITDVPSLYSVESIPLYVVCYVS